MTFSFDTASVSFLVTSSDVYGNSSPLIIMNSTKIQIYLLRSVLDALSTLSCGFGDYWFAY